MLKHSELIKSPEYWMENIQNEIYYELSKTGEPAEALAKEIGINRGLVRQALRGNFNGRIKDFVKIALYLGKWPLPDEKLPQK